VVEGRARTISVWLVMLMISLAAAPAAASTGEKAEAAPAGKAEASGGAKPKAEAKPKADGSKEDKKGEGKGGAEKVPAANAEKEPAKDAKTAKAEAKSDTKDAKSDAKAPKNDTKADAKKDTKADAKDTKSDAKAPKNDATADDAKNGAKAESKKGTKTAEKAASSKTPKSGEAGAVGEQPPTGPLTPPLKLNNLRDEMSRPPARHDEHVATKAEREKLEQLAAEINKAREGLRQDTAKLEAMLAARDAAPAPLASAGTPSSGDSGEPAKKVPLPIDNLAKAIRGMKPEQAAPIISRIDRKLAADVLLRMPGADAGKVLGVCKPEVAAEIAAEIASRTPRAELRR